MSNSMTVDGVFASQALDSSGEVLDIKGIDVSTMEDGNGWANFEHNGADGKADGTEIVGKITYVKKIFKEDDCDDERQAGFWRQLKMPFLYGKVRLLDGADHPSAKAIAAIIRDAFAHNEPLNIGFSIEGSTLKKEGNVLKRTIAKRVALTLKSCNKTAYLGLLADPNAPQGFEKDFQKPDLLAILSHRAKVSKTEDPLLQTLGGSEAIYGSEMLKTMTAGGLDAAPSTYTGGTALVQIGTLGQRAYKAYKKWDRKKPLKTFLKAHLPEVSDEFLKHFEAMVDNHEVRIAKAQEELYEASLPPVEKMERLLRKAQELTVDLKKAAREAEPTPEHVQFQGKTIKPGLATHRTSKEPFAILHSTPDAFTAVPQKKLGMWDHSDMVKIPRNHEDSAFWDIKQHPVDVQASGVVHKDHHGVQGYLKHDDVADMVHGLDLHGAVDRKTAGRGINNAFSGWMDGPQGKVYVKANPKESEFSEARAEGAYHNLARDFFGMGQYLPKVAVIAHPATGQEHAVVEHVPGEHYDSDNDDHEFQLHKLNESGELHKLSLMNMLMQNPDRHQFNYMLDKDKGMKLIDHGLSFSYANEPQLPHYQRMVTKDGFGELLHPAAREWAMSLKPREFQLQLKSHGIPNELANESVNRLRALQGHLLKDPNASISSAYTQPQLMTSSGYAGQDVKTGK